MARNIEIKAVATNFETQLEIAERLSDAPVEILKQEDTFFQVPNGRLKLRIFADAGGELIFYRRADTVAAKESTYRIYPASDPENLKKTIESALGVIGTVKKTRYLYHYGQTRIHLDDVEGLGKFIEFEYVLKPAEDPIRGQFVIEKLMENMKILPNDRESHAYLDLLLSR